jgi:hypothetical protein
MMTLAWTEAMITLAWSLQNDEVGELNLFIPRMLPGLEATPQPWVQWRR